MVRAREGREHPAGLEEPESAQVDLLVAAGCYLHRVLPARERRRVQHDQPEALAAGLEIAERVEGIGLPELRPVGGAVELEIAPGERQGFR